jgi:hypothetical protein
LRAVRTLALVVSLALAGCGSSNFGDGTVDLNGDGKGISRVAVELGALKALKRGAEICVTGEPLPFGIDNPCADKPDMQDKAGKAVPYLADAIDALAPLVDSTDKAAIDAAFDLANKARGML